MSSFPINMSLFVIMCFILLGWGLTYKIVFSLRDAGRMLRAAKRKAISRDIEKVKGKVELKKVREGRHTRCHRVHS